MKKYNFDFDVSALANYTEEPSELIMTAVQGARTTEFMTIQPGIKSSETINIVDSAVTFQAGSCAFNASGNDTVTQRTISVCDIKVNKEYCLKDLEAKFTQKLLSPGANYSEDDIPQIFIDQTTANLAYEIEKLLWIGDTNGSGNTSMCDGLNVLVDASTGAVRVSSGTAWSASVAIETVYQMTSNVPTEIRDRSDLHLFMGRDQFDVYQKEVFDLNNRWLEPKDGTDGMALYTNIPIVVVNGLNGTNRMMLTYKENMYLGTDLLNDTEAFELWYSKDNRQHRLVIEFKIGVQFAFPEFVVYYNA